MKKLPPIRQCFYEPQLKKLEAFSELTGLPIAAALDFILATYFARGLKLPVRPQEPIEYRSYRPRVGLSQRLDVEAKRIGVNKSEVIREIVEYILEREDIKNTFSPILIDEISPDVETPETPKKAKETRSLLELSKDEALKTNLPIGTKPDEA
jgi:hypothetical protein